MLWRIEHYLLGPLLCLTTALRKLHTKPNWSFSSLVSHWSKHLCDTVRKTIKISNFVWTCEKYVKELQVSTNRQVRIEKGVYQRSHFKLLNNFAKNLHLQSVTDVFGTKRRKGQNVERTKRQIIHTFERELFFQ